LATRTDPAIWLAADDGLLATALDILQADPDES